MQNNAEVATVSLGEYLTKEIRNDDYYLTTIVFTHTDSLNIREVDKYRLPNGEDLVVNEECQINMPRPVANCLIDMLVRGFFESKGLVSLDVTVPEESWIFVNDIFDEAIVVVVVNLGSKVMSNVSIFRN